MEVLKRTEDAPAIVVSHPVGAGGTRGAHNCGECDDRIYNAIKDYSTHADPTVLDKVECGCREVWQEVLERETSWRAPLA